MTMGEPAHNSPAASLVFPVLIRPVLSQVEKDHAAAGQTLRAAISRVEATHPGFTYDLVMSLVTKAELSVNMNEAILRLQGSLGESEVADYRITRTEDPFQELNRKSMNLKRILSRIPDEISDRKTFLETIKGAAKALATPPRDRISDEAYAGCSASSVLYNIIYIIVLEDNRTLKKSSSCSTIYLDDSTVSQPNLKNTIKCVALAIYYHIKFRASNRIIDIFDEKLHPLTRDGVHPDYDTHNPEQRHIYKFVRTLFNAAQLTAECAIITLVYLERLITYADIDMTPGTWKRIVLGAIILASKVWDDQAVWNVDYCQILRDISVDDMNELEREYLVLVQFNINVPSSVYAKYYFALRTLAESNDMAFPSEPLSKERAQKLEAMSRVCEDRYTQNLGRNGHKKWSSLDNISSSRRSIAILS